MRLPCSSAVCVMLAALAIGGCGSSSSSSSSGGKSSSTTTAAASAGGGSKSIFLMMPLPCATSAYFADLCSGAQYEAKSDPPGIHFALKAVPYNADAQPAIDEIQTILLEHPAVMATLPLGKQEVPMLDTAAARGTKVVFVDSDLPGFAHTLTFIGTDNLAAGQAAGKWLVANGSKATSKTVALVLNQPGIASTDARAQGFKQVVEGAGWKVVAAEPTVSSGAIVNCDTNAARSLVTNYLTAHPNLGAVFNVCDLDAAGTALALKAAGKLSVFNVGVDGTPQGVELILHHQGYEADVAQSPYLEGIAAVKAMVAAAKGQPVQPRIVTPLCTVDASSASAFLARGGHC